MGVAGGNKNKGAGVVMWGKNSNADQVWSFNSDDELESKCTDCVLDIHGMNQDEGAKVHMWNKNKEWNQKWKKVAYKNESGGDSD
jgi:hypothetical protein